LIQIFLTLLANGYQMIVRFLTYPMFATALSGGKEPTKCCIFIKSTIITYRRGLITITHKHMYILSTFSSIWRIGCPTLHFSTVYTDKKLSYR